MENNNTKKKMKSHDEEYYEDAKFWNPQNVNIIDQARVKRVIELIHNDSESLLDVGCGNGILCNQVQQFVPGLKRVVGYDRSSEAIKYVSTEKKIGKINCLPFNENEFDTVCALEILEHLPMTIYEEAIKEISRVSGKSIILTVPNNENLSKNMISCPNCYTKFHRHYHMQTFNPESMNKIFRRFSFKCVHIEKIVKYEEKIFFTKIQSLYNKVTKNTMFMNALCPGCGYTERNDAKQGNLKKVQQPGWKKFLKNIWPKIEKFNWLVAVYEKS